MRLRWGWPSRAFRRRGTALYQDHLPPGSEASEASPQERISALLDDAINLHSIKDLDQPYRLEMQKLGVDLHKLQGADPGNSRVKAAIINPADN